MTKPKDQEQKTVEWKEFEKHRARFFSLIGHCITEYQKVEDYLSNVFSAALGINEDKALKMFSIVRGLEAKLDMISAALHDASEDHQHCWQALLKRVAASAEARNQIAHANPVHIIKLYGSLGSGTKPPEKTEPDRMELRKKTRKGDNVWTVELLIAEYERADKLFSHLIAFVKRLKSEPVPVHLEEP